MNADTQTAQQDLAFLKALVSNDGGANIRGMGLAFAVAGLIYGVQFALHGLQLFGQIPSGTALSLTIGFGPSVLFLAFMGWLAWRNRKLGQGGTVNRAINLVFAVCGASNLGLAAIVLVATLKLGDSLVWMIYPCTVFVPLGAAWMVMALLRRRAWMGFVAATYYAFGVAMALSLNDMRYYLLVGGLAMIACLTVPGLIILRQSARAG